MLEAIGGDDADLLEAIQEAERRALDAPRPPAEAWLQQAEQAAREGRWSFEADGGATLEVGERRLRAGRFAPRTLGSLAEAAGRAPAEGRPSRLWAVIGDAACTDIGALQASAPDRTLFQVASQFNALEAPSPRRVVDPSAYVSDPTQGPRASVSAFAGTLLRHFAAPGPTGRFVQRSGGPQVQLLGEVCGPGLAEVVNGYLLPDRILDPPAFARRLESDHDRVAVGLHEDLEVLFGARWWGAVHTSRPIAQVFTSTVAAGGYGALGDGPEWAVIVRQLLRAAYAGTLLAAAATGQRRVVLTLIGGGVFGNPHPAIWEAITWAFDQHAPGRGLDVVVNARDAVARVGEPFLRGLVAARGGAVVQVPRGGAPSLRR